MSSAYHIAVGSYEGPFDLLLQLIARRKVDIYEVPLAQITDDYLAVLREMEEIDLEVTTEFLVVAATLLELKAARLLPAEEDPELEELAVEARDLLYARLLDYRTFKEAASWLRDRLDANDGHVPRTAGPDPAFAGLRPPATLGVEAQALARIAARALAEQPGSEVSTSHLQPVRLTVREAAAMVLDELHRAGGRATFRELTAGCRHRVEVIVHFLAVLELCAQDHVEVEQPERFGVLTVELSEHAGTPVVTDAYEGTAGGPAAAAAGEAGR